MFISLLIFRYMFFKEKKFPGQLSGRRQMEADSGRNSGRTCLRRNQKANGSTSQPNHFQRSLCLHPKSLSPLLQNGASLQRTYPVPAGRSRKTGHSRGAGCKNLYRSCRTEILFPSVSREDCWKERKVKRSPRMDSSGCRHCKFPQRSHY